MGSVLITARKRRDSRPSIKSRQHIVRRISRRNDEFARVRPDRHEKVIQHGSAECPSNPFCCDRCDDFADKLRGLGAGGDEGWEDSAV